MNRAGLISLFALSLCLAALFPGNALAQAVESEPLPPMDIVPPPAQPQGFTPAPASAAPKTGMPEGTPAPGNSVVGEDPSAVPIWSPSGAPAPAQPTPSGDLGTEATPTGSGMVPPDASSDPSATAPADAYKPDTTYNSPVTGVVPPQKNTAGKKFCTLEIAFGSFAAGTDTKTGERIKSYLDSNPDKLTYVRSNWGKEGEYSYCLEVTQHKNRAEIYKDLKKLLPAKADRVRAPTTLSGKGFAPVRHADQ